MVAAIISDVHANLEALERVLADARREGADEIVCLGDIVGYGPLPRETLAAVRDACSVVVAGNHDDAVSGRGDASAFIDLAGDAAARHRDALGADGIAYLRALPYEATCGEAALVHGDLADPPNFNYVESEEDAAANFAATDAKLVFVGHTHVPCIFLVGRSGTIYRTNPQDFTLETGKRYIVNPGSVGYPREADGRCLSSYVLYDTVERTVRFRFLPFSVSSVMQRGRTRIPRRRVIAAAIAALALAAAVGAAIHFKGRRDRLAAETRVEELERREAQDAALVVAEKALKLGDGATKVYAGLHLSKGSDPVALSVVFRDAAGFEIAANAATVRTSSTKKWDAPRGAASVVFTVKKLRPDDSPEVKRFEPASD